MIRTKKAKTALTKLNKVRSIYDAAIENNNEMMRGEVVQFGIDCNRGELEFAKDCLETSRALLTKPFESYTRSNTGRYTSKRAESYAKNKRLIETLETSLIRAESRLMELQELSHIETDGLKKDVEKEQLHYDKVILEETAKIEAKATKKLEREKVDRERASVPVNIFSKEDRNGRRFLIEDLLAKMTKRKGFITFGNQEYVGGIPLREFLFILRLHKKSIAEINFAPKDVANRVNVFIDYRGGNSKFSFIAHELDEHDIVNVINFTN